MVGTGPYRRLLAGRRVSEIMAGEYLRSVSFAAISVPENAMPGWPTRVDSSRFSKVGTGVFEPFGAQTPPPRVGRGLGHLIVRYHSCL